MRAVAYKSKGAPPPGSTTSEGRSPSSARFDPPVAKREWITDGALPLDEFLADARRRGGWDDAAWERLLRHAGIHLDRVRLCPEARPDVVPARTHVLAYALVREPEPVVIDRTHVLFDEDGVVACNKPPWLTTQGRRGSRESSLERALRLLLSCPWLSPVNRLDRETSGLVLFARDSRAAGVLGRQLQRRTLVKEYLAVVSPPPRAQAFEVEAPMIRVWHPSHSLFTLRGDGLEGRASHTRFEVVEQRGDRALVRALPLTGRTHQLRVHLAHVGSPIVGDSLYGPGWQAGAPWSAERLQLHAASVTFRLAPGDDAPPVTVAAPAPADFGLDA